MFCLPMVSWIWVSRVCMLSRPFGNAGISKIVLDRMGIVMSRYLACKSKVPCS